MNFISITILIGVLWCQMSKGDQILTLQENADLLGWQQTLRARAELTDATTYFLKQQLVNEVGLDQFLADTEQLLDGKMTYSDFSKKLTLAKTIGFGRSHRQIWLNALDKLVLAQPNQKEISNEQKFQHQMLGTAGASRKQQAHWDRFLTNWKSYRVVLVDGEAMDLEQLRFLKQHTEPLRFCFISPTFEPNIIVGDLHELLEKNPTKKPILPEQDKDLAESNWFTLNRDGQVASLKASRKLDQPTWWEQNKSWTWPVLILAGGLAIYSVKDSNVELSLPSF